MLVVLPDWINLPGLAMYHGNCAPPSLVTRVRVEYRSRVMFLGSMLVTVMFHAQYSTVDDTLAPGCQGPMGIPFELVSL